MSLANWIQQGELVLCKNCFGNNFSTFRLPASYFQSFILVTACSRSTSLPNLGRIILMQKTIMEVFVRFQSWRKSIIVDSTNLFLWVGGGTSLLKSLSSSWDFGHGIECPSPRKPTWERGIDFANSWSRCHGDSIWTTARRCATHIISEGSVAL